jgi:hypothetical protein
MGLGSGIRDPEKNLFQNLDPGSRGQKGTRLRIRNTGSKNRLTSQLLFLADLQ